MDLSSEISFISYLTDARSKSANTARAYDADVRKFQLHCRRQGHTAEDCLTRIGVSLFLLKAMDSSRSSDLSRTSVSSRSAARIVSSLKAWADYLVFNGRINTNLLKNLQPPKYSRKLPSYFRVDEIISLVSAFEGDDSAIALRNNAILHLIYSAGLRVSECASLDILQIAGDGMVRVQGKGGKQRIVPIGERAIKAIAEYLAHSRPKLAEPQSGTALWLNARNGGRLTDRSMRNILNDAALLSGLAKPVSPHKLRHACATHMLEGGADVRLLQEFLGHSSLNTTQVYTQVTRTHLRDVYLETHPRAKKQD